MNLDKYLAILAISFFAIDAGAQMLSGASPTLGAINFDDQTGPAAPSVLRPIVDPVSHRMRLGIKLKRSSETKQVSDSEKTLGQPVLPSVESGRTAVGNDLGLAQAQTAKGQLGVMPDQTSVAGGVSNRSSIAGGLKQNVALPSTGRAGDLSNQEVGFGGAQ